jgi:hypothetical protein
MKVGGFVFAFTDPRSLDPSDSRIYEAVTLVAPSSNTGTVYVGSVETQLVPLNANASITIWHDALTDIWVKDSTIGDQIIWFTGKECCCGCNCPKKMK